jgi:signal transduction histidine kinase
VDFYGIISSKVHIGVIAMMKNENNDINIDLLEIKDVIDINLLQTFQDSFAESLNIASITVDRNGNPVTNPSSYTSFCTDFVHSTASGDNRCAESHRKGGEEATRTGRPFIYTCHAGLIDFAAPILIKDKQIGTILGGQVLTRKPEKSKYIQTAREIGVDENKFIESLNSVNITTEKNVKAAAEVLFIIANALSKIGYEELTLKKISKDLENEVLEKNLLLKESNEYNKLKTQLFSTMSHELKTPINIIFSALQLLEDSFRCESVTNTVDLFLKYSMIMKQNCYRLIRLINNLIDMNKIDLGFCSMNLRNDNIVKVIEDITLSVVEYARLKNIQLIFDTDEEDIITAFDSEKLERIMLNLLSNSIKFTQSGGKIVVSVHGQNDNILISVKDNGIGIPQDMLQKIFNPFTQVDASLKRNAEGSGLGLSIVKSMVEMHDGDITVKSQLNAGSEFLIRLPLKQAEEKLAEEKHEHNIVNDNVEETKIELSDISL